MDNEDPYHWQAPWPPRSKVKVAMSYGASDWCWPISRERKVPEILKLVGRLPTLRAILRTCFRVKRSKVKVSREPESVSYLRSGKAYELQNWYADGACYQLPRPAMKFGSCTRAGAYRVGRTRRPHNLLLLPTPTLSVGVGRIFESVCLSVFLSVCPQHNSKTNNPKVLKCSNLV